MAPCGTLWIHQEPSESHLGPAGGHRPLPSHTNGVQGLGIGAQGWGANDALAARRTTISMFPDCNSSSVVIDLHDHVFINNEKAEDVFPYKTNCVLTISQKWMFRNVWKSIEFGNPGPPKRHKYHKSWKRNTLQLLMFWGLKDAWGIKCLHKFAR